MRWYDGAVYRIGELANITNVSKRTIDYYTSLGLLKAKRSKSNYRIYSHHAIDDLKYIEECKKLHFTLEEIKRKLEIKKSKVVHEKEVEKHIQSVIQEIKLLQNEVNAIKPLIRNLGSQKANQLAKILNSESEALIDSLLNFKN